MGTVSIRELRIHCIVGIHDFERVTEQDLFLDIDMDFDFARVIASDHIADTVDYTEVATTLTNFIRDEKFQIIETLAHRAGELVLAKWPFIERCRLVVRKPAAVPDSRGAVVSVALERGA